MKFKYLDKVLIIDGFYKYQKGIIEDFDIFGAYKVRLGRNKAVYIKEKYLIHTK